MRAFTFNAVCLHPVISRNRIFAGLIEVGAAGIQQQQSREHRAHQPVSTARPLHEVDLGKGAFFGFIVHDEIAP